MVMGRFKNQRKARNPLHCRFFRELKSDLGKYLAIFFFMGGVIALVSGFLVADNSLIKAYDESFDKYNVEDGNFELPARASNKLIQKLEKKGACFYENFYIDEETVEIDSTLRIFSNREKVNKLCIMEGSLPKNDSEIAIDRMYAENNNLQVGNILTAGGESYKICGLVALSDYSALFSSNSDMMFDAVKFGVAVVTKNKFESLNQKNIHYVYSWRYRVRPENDADDKKKSNKILYALYKVKKDDIVNFTPRGANQAICFTGDDMGGDRAMFTMFLYIVIAIIAFIIAVTTGNTITKESMVIGTLRASGYTKNELIRHYLTMPFVVAIVAAVVGNILGYSFFKTIFAQMYYGSYSLPTYKTVWNMDAFFRTTIIPIALIMGINFFMIQSKLTLSPLKFLKSDLRKNRNKKAFQLNTKLPFFTRFRCRIIFQNKFNYIVLFTGIIFAEFIFLFGMMLHPILNRYENDITNHMIADYQYILKNEAKTKESNAEKICVESLNTVNDNMKSESITVYGISEESSYVSLDFDGGQVYVSDGFAKKYKLKAGEILTLEESYGSARYGFTIQGIYECPAVMGVFMSQDSFNDLFNKEDGFFNGYFSDQKIKDINENDIATIITKEDMTKVCRQLDLSMGDMMSLFTGFGTIMFLLLIYLLSKQIIEKNERAISMVKILGYDNKEINRLYLSTTTIVVFISIFAGMPACKLIMRYLFDSMLADFSGYLPFYVASYIYPMMLVMGVVCYFFVSIFQMRKIKKIAMSDALKNME